MPIYTAPTEDMQFVLHDVLKIAESDAPGYSDLDRDFTAAILGEAAKLAEEVLQPLNRVGDEHGCTLENGVVRTPPGFADAYEQMRAGGWIGIDVPEEFGGQGLPYLMYSATGEMFVAANMAFNMYQGLSHGAAYAIRMHGSEAQRATYLPRMTEGSWTGTMNLTEPHCGTDLGLIRTKAEPQGRRQLPHLGAEDLDLRRRARHGRQHHPPRPREDPRRPRGREGHLSLHRAEVPPQ